MPIRVYNRTSAGRRNSSVNLHAEVTKQEPEKTLLRKLNKRGGRNVQGKITVRGRGGGHKRRYRAIDWRRSKDNMTAVVIGIEYDPNRTAHIALLEYEDGDRRYVIAPKGLKDGEKLVSSQSRVEPKTGNCMPLRFIPTGLNVHCLELVPGKGAQLCRSAGGYARLTNRDDQWATIVMPSGEIRQVSVDCRATIGEVGNQDHQQVRIGKAGRNRHRGRRPKTRGVAMSHHAHPLGGGEGRSKSNRAPAGPSGTLSKGSKTRARKKPSNKRIIRRRRSRRYGQLTL